MNDTTPRFGLLIAALRRHAEAHPDSKQFYAQVSQDIRDEVLEEKDGVIINGIYQVFIHLRPDLPENTVITYEFPKDSKTTPLQNPSTEADG